MRYEPGQLFCVMCPKATTKPYQSFGPDSTRCLCSEKCFHAYHSDQAAQLEALQRYGFE